MKLLIFISILGSSLLSSLSFAEDSVPPEGNSYFMCKSGKSVRTIRVEKSPSGCKTTYTKEGVDSVAAKITQDENKCQSVADRIRSHLETGKWSCRDISAARMSYSQ